MKKLNLTVNQLEAIKAIKAVNSACAGITVGADYDCANPPVAGVDQRLILINKSVYDEATITYDGSLTSLITNIVLAAGGKQGWAFQGVRTSLKPQSNFVAEEIAVGYDHQVDFLVFDISQAQKDNLEKLGVSKVVAIVQNMNSAGNADSVFEVFGGGVGLELITNQRINGDQATMGVWSLSLKTSDNSGKEPKLPTSYFDTDFATTKAKVDALLVPTA